MTLDHRAAGGKYKESDAVWLYQPRRKKGLSSKLTPVWEAPYNVVKRLNDVLEAALVRALKGKMKFVHLDKLKKYQGLDEADRDDQGLGLLCSILTERALDLG